MIHLGFAFSSSAALDRKKKEKMIALELSQKQDRYSANRVTTKKLYIEIVA